MTELERVKAESQGVKVWKYAGNEKPRPSHVALQGKRKPICTSYEELILEHKIWMQFMNSIRPKCQPVD